MIKLLLLATSGLAATLIAGLGLSRVFEPGVDPASTPGVVARQGAPGEDTPPERSAGETPQPGGEKTPGGEKEEPATPGGDKTPTKELKVAVRFEGSGSMSKEAVDHTLTELIRDSEVIVAGQFVLGGNENSFIVKEVIAGDDVPQQIRLLTDNGLICPAPANPRLGSWAVAFAEATADEISVPSSGWLRQFSDERTFLDFVTRTKAYVDGKAVPLILSMIKEQPAGPDVEAIDFDGIYKKMQEIQEAMKRGEKIDESELERLENMLGGVRGEADAMDLLSSPGQLRTDLQLIGGLEAGIGVMEILGAGKLEPAVRRDLTRCLAKLPIVLESSARDEDSRAPGGDDAAAADRDLEEA
ncbi:MAG: hypothetical protein RDV41_11410, partial [Planctomycetota bacterium]|nr:hypothetical protein [Planctomycetota bacterium]